MSTEYCLADLDTVIILLTFSKKNHGWQLVWTSKLVNSTVRLLTHVLCKPTHSFFKLFIATMYNSLQTSFSRFMKNWPNMGHVWGTPTKSPSMGYTLFYQIPQKDGIHMLLEIYQK